MSVPTQFPIIFHVDQEHSGIRYGVLFILFVAFWLSFLAIRAILQASFPLLGSSFILSCIGAIPLSLLISGISEKVLKRTWHSGRQLVLDEATIRLHRPQQEEQSIRRDQPLNGLWWYFPLGAYPRGGRERRMPGKWFCLAGQWQQDEARIVVYCYAPPGEANKWVERYEFRQLEPADVYDTTFSARVGAPSRPELTPDVISSKDGKFWLAERNRWREGVELTSDDFAALLRIVRDEQ